MQKNASLIWFFLLAILILPTAAGRLLLDLAGGIILIFFTISLVLACLGWFWWKKINAIMQTCKVCGAKSLSNSSQCMICGSKINTDINSNTMNVEANQATIDIIAKETEEGN